MIFAIASLQVGSDLPEGVKAPIAILIGIGVFMILLAMYAFSSERNALQFEAFLQGPAKWFGISTWQFALIMIGLPFSILAHYAAGEVLLMYSPFVAWMAWTLAILFVVAGGWQPGSLELKSWQKTLLIAAGLVALGYLMRGFTPESYPIAFSGNEGSFGIWGTDILDGKFNNPFRTGWYSFPGLYFFIPAASIAILGHTLEALRVPSILAGSLTVGATYLTGRVLYRHRVGLLAALLLAGFGLHIHLSRFGLNNVWDGLFFVVVAGAALYAWEREHRNAFLLAGFALGLSQYFYVTSRALLALILVWLVVLPFVDRSRFKRLLPGIVLMGLAALVVLLPLAWFYVHNPARFFRRMLHVNVFGESLGSVLQSDGPLLLKIILEKIWLGAQSFTHLPITNSWFATDTPFLWPPLAEFFLVGLVFIIFRLREGRNVLVLIWLVLFVFIGAFSENIPPPQRYVAVVPVCLMVAAFGLNKMAEILEKIWPRIMPVSTALVILLCGYLSFKDATSYYIYYTPLSRYYYVAEANTLIAQHLGKFLQTQPDDTQVVFFGYPRMGYYSIPSLQYLAPKIVGLDMGEPWGSRLNPHPDSNHLVFVFLPHYIEEIPLVQAVYSGGELFEEETYWRTVLYYYYVYEAMN